MVRRGLQESIYDLLDENTGYLAAWVRASSKDEDKDRIDDGYEAVVRDQAQVLAKVLREGTPLGREGILNALWDFHIRHYALPPLKADTVSIGLPAVLTKYVTGVPDLHRPGYEYPPYRETVNFKYDVHNGFFQTRIGNDSDLIHFFKSSGPELEDALLACLKGADDSMKIEVLKAGSTLSGAGDERFTLAALNLSEDSERRRAADSPLRLRGRPARNPEPRCAGRARSQLVDKVVEILKHGNPDSQAVVLPLLAALPDNSAWEQQAECPGRVAVAARAETAARRIMRRSSMPLHRSRASCTNRSCGNRCWQGCIPSTPMCSAPPCGFPSNIFSSDPETAPAVKTAFANLNTSALSILMEEVGNPQFLSRRLGVAGGAVSQDQEYLNRQCGRIERSRSRWRIPSCSTRCWPPCSTRTPTCAPPRWIFCAR